MYNNPSTLDTTPAKVSIKLDIFTPPEGPLPEQILLRQNIKEFLNKLRVKSNKHKTIPVVPYLETKSMFEQADFHVSRQFNKNYRTTVGTNNTSFSSWLPITSPSELLNARNRNTNLKLRTQQTILKNWTMVAQIENEHDVEAWEPISLEEHFVKNMEKYMYDIGILGESLFLNDISRQPMILAQALLNPNISVEDANTLADFILFRLYHPCIINASSLTKVFFQRLLFEIESTSKHKIEKCIMTKLYLMPENLKYLKSLLDIPFNNLYKMVKENYNHLSSGNNVISIEKLIRISLSIYKVIINRKSTNMYPSVITFIVYCMKNNSVFTDGDIVDVLVNKYVYPSLIKRVTRGYVWFSCKKNISGKRRKLTALDKKMKLNVECCGKLLKLFTTIGPLDLRGKEIMQLGTIYGNEYGNENGINIVADFVNRIRPDLREYEKLFIHDLSVIGKQVQWIDVEKNDSFILNSSFDLNVTTVGEIEEFKRILEADEYNYSLKSTIAKYRQNKRYYNHEEKNIIRPLITLKNVKAKDEIEFKTKHLNVMKLFNRLYYLINDHDAGADEELRHVFKEIHYFLPHIDNVETYHRILRDNEQILNKNFEAACAECDHLLRFKARLRKNNMEDVSYISKKERRQTLSLHLNNLSFPLPSSPQAFDFTRDSSFLKKQTQRDEEAKSFLNNHMSLNDLKTSSGSGIKLRKKSQRQHQKRRRVSTFERPANWKDEKAKNKIERLRTEKEKMIKAECTFQPNTEKVRREQHEKLGIDPELFPTRVWGNSLKRKESSSPKTSYAKKKSSPVYSSFFTGKSQSFSKQNRKLLNGEKQENRIISPSSKLTPSPPTPTRRKSLSPTRRKSLSQRKERTHNDVKESKSFDVGDEMAEPVLDLDSGDDELKFSDCVNDDEKNDIVTRQDSISSMINEKTINSLDEEELASVKFPVPLISRQELLDVFNIIKATDIHNNVNVCEIIRQLFVNEELQAIFRIKNQESLFQISENTDAEHDYDDAVVTLDLFLMNGIVLEKEKIDLKRNLPHQIQKLSNDGGNGDVVYSGREMLLRQIFKRLALLTEVSTPILSKLILALLVLSTNTEKSLTFDSLINKFEQMEAIPAVVDDFQRGSRSNNTKSRRGSSSGISDKSQLIKYLRRGSTFYVLWISSNSDGVSEIKSNHIQLTLSSDEERIFRRPLVSVNHGVKRKFYFSISTIEKISQGLPIEMDQIKISTTSSISPWLCFHVKTSDYTTGKIKTAVLQAENLQSWNNWISGFRHLINKKRGRFGSDANEEIVDSQGKMIWARVKSRMRRASRIQKSSISKTFIKALGVDKDVTKILREKHISEFIRSTEGAIPSDYDETTHSRLVRDGTLYMKYSKAGFFSSKWKRRYITLSLFLPMDFPSHLDKFETIQPYAELNYHQGKDLLGSVKIDKHSVVMRIADQRSMEFHVRRNIATMRRKSKTSDGVRYDVALKTEKNGVESVSKWCKSIRLVIKICRLYDKERL